MWISKPNGCRTKCHLLFATAVLSVSSSEPEEGEISTAAESEGGAGGARIYEEARGRGERTKLASLVFALVVVQAGAQWGRRRPDDLVENRGVVL